MRKLFFSIALTIFVLSITSAQSGKEVKILYKDYPYLVTIDENGDLNYVIRAALEVMEGQDFDKNREMPIPIGPYTRRKSADVALEEYISPDNTTEVGETVAVIEAQKSKPKAPVKLTDKDAITFDPKKKVEPIDRQFETTVIRSTPEKDEADYYLTFPGFTSRLTPQLTDVIRDISKAYEANPVELVLINSYVTSGDATNRKLAEARIKSCYDLLQTYGVPFDVLMTEIKPYQTDIDGNVSITFK